MSIVKLMKLSNIQFEGIDHNDYPDYVDANVSYAEENGEPLTDEELDELNEDSERVYELLMDYLH